MSIRDLISNVDELDEDVTVYAKRINGKFEGHSEVALLELPEEDVEFIKEVKKHFQDLGENCRELLIRFYYKKESMRTISEHFDWTEASTRNNKYRCLQKLRELLKNKPLEQK